jgi:hypothetical protein
MAEPTSTVVGARPIERSKASRIAASFTEPPDERARCGVEHGIDRGRRQVTTQAGGELGDGELKPQGEEQ